jgi:hypothetical protein
MPMDIEKLDDGSIKYSVWWKNGSMLVNREYLSPDHPESLYQQLTLQGYVPENYGIKSFSEKMAFEFKDWNRDRLIAEVIELRKTVANYERFI